MDTNKALDNTSKHKHHLKILSIFHYIFAGIVGIFSCIPIIHLALGILMLTGRLSGAEMSVEDAEAAKLFGTFMVVLGSLAILFGFTVTVLLILSGRYLTRQKKCIFSMVIAAISCVYIPLGTILGIFTLVELSKDQTKALYDKQKKL